MVNKELDELYMGIYRLSRPYCDTNKEDITVDGEIEIFSSNAVAAMRWGILQVSALVENDCVCTVRIYDSRGEVCFSTKGRLCADGTGFTVGFYYKKTDRMSITVESSERAEIQAGGATVIINGGKQ